MLVNFVSSPVLLKLYTETTFRQIQHYSTALKVGGHNINKLRYAGDTMLLAENETQLQTYIRIAKHLYRIRPKYKHTMIFNDIKDTFE